MQQVEMDNKFGAVTRAVVILDRYKHPLSANVRKQFNSAPQRFRVCMCSTIKWCALVSIYNSYQASSRVLFSFSTYSSVL